MPKYRTYPITLAFLTFLGALGLPGLSIAAEPPTEPAPPAPKSGEPVAEEPVADEHVLVEGQITDPIGAGNSGVTVTVRWKGEGTAEGELIATATTDELGDFKVTTPEPLRGDIVVTMSKPMYDDIVRELHVGDSEWPEFLAEQFQGNLVVIGRVADALTNAPIADASVTLDASYNEWRATTDEHGHFTLKGVAPGAGELIVEREGYGRERQPVRQLEDFGEIPVLLKPERVLNLKIVDDLDAPIGGVTVECYDGPRDDFRTLVTDAEGSAILRGVHFDAAVLSARLTHEEHVSSEGFDREIITPSETTESVHKLMMERAGKISGNVTGARLGGPLQGARLMTGIEYSDESPRDWTDYQGNYTIRGVRPGKVTVTIHHSEYAPELKKVDVTAGKTTRLDVALRRGASIQGIVKTESGKPAPGVQIDATYWRGVRTLGLRALSGLDGKFVIENAPHDAFEVMVTTEDMGRLIRTVQAGGDEQLVFTVSDAPVKIETDTRVFLRPGDTAPSVSMTTLDGKVIELGKLRDKVILVSFWATWCSPCLADLPYFRKVFQKFGDRDDLVIVAVSLDADENALREFLEKEETGWLHVCGEAGGARIAAEKFGVRAIPTVLIIGPYGRVQASGVRGEDILRRIEQTVQNDEPM